MTAFCVIPTLQHAWNDKILEAENRLVVLLVTDLQRHGTNRTLYKNSLPNSRSIVVHFLLLCGQLWANFCINEVWVQAPFLSYGFPIASSPFVWKDYPSSIEFICFSVKNPLSIFVWGYFWVPCSVPWISASNSLTIPGTVSEALHSLLTGLTSAPGFLL